MAAVGLALGTGVALLTSRGLSGLQFGVSTYDPITLVSTASLLIAVVDVAIVVPAFRATRVDPRTALREE
jgi:ABC-type antimicrobial peptide transport system permease subunit